MFKIKCALLIAVMTCSANTAVLSTAFAGEDSALENGMEIASCAIAVNKCREATKDAADKDVIGACKALRQCKKECRQEKRDCKKEARGEKKDCKEECRDKFGTGKDYRDCADNCRDYKKDAKSECKEEKEVCKDSCIGTYKTPECEAARKVMLPTIGACAQALFCTGKLIGEAAN